MVELKVHGARLWEREQLADIMDASVILHMLVEDERGIHDIPDDNTYEQGHSPHLARPNPWIRRGPRKRYGNS